METTHLMLIPLNAILRWNRRWNKKQTKEKRNDLHIDFVLNCYSVTDSSSNPIRRLRLKKFCEGMT